MNERVDIGPYPATQDYTAQRILSRWQHMMKEGLVKTNDVIRVEVNEDGTIDLYDFSLPSKGGLRCLNIPQKDVDTWIMESISMLRIAENNDLVPELGFKISDTLYYILNREGEMA